MDNLERRVKINHNSIEINLNKIKQLEQKINNIEHPRPKLFTTKGYDVNLFVERLDELEKMANKKIEKAEKMAEEKIEKAEKMAEEKIKMMTKKVNEVSDENKLLKIELTKFKSEITPRVNKLSEHKIMREKREEKRRKKDN